VTKTILLVEDEPTDAFFFSHCVKKAGLAHPVQIAQDGREALDYLKGSGQFADREKYPLPCLVILDLKLPHTTGFEVLEHLRQHPKLRSLIVVVLTSSSSHQDIEKAYELGAKAYLIKPTDSHQLLQIVKALSDFWLTHNHSPPSSCG
jgi:CheY-like chemotaxis protein